MGKVALAHLELETDWKNRTLVFGVPFFELFDAAFSIHDFLGAGKEGMAGAADIHTDSRQSGAGFNHIPTNASGFYFVVGGVNLLTHGAVFSGNSTINWQGYYAILILVLTVCKINT
jgi:hypothetical protein